MSYNPRPVTITGMVRRWIEATLRQAGKFDNVTFAIDRNGIYELQELAAKIYAEGFNDGMVTGMEQVRSEREVSA